ncbi:MAG: tetratricopeptide repeat protein [Patescibacteria group bacterium]|nr:tetratricopeptide repeat protein [Patescibacteria group bacterium]
MNFLETRRQIVFAIAFTIFVVALVYAGLANSNAIKYRGLTLVEEIQMDDATRVAVEARIATTKAAIAAQKGSADMDLNLYTNLAFDASLLGDLVLERETYEEYFTHNSINYTAWNNYGNVLAAMGDPKKAEEAYRKAVELQPHEEFYRDLIDLIRKNDPEGDREEEVRDLLLEGVDRVGQKPWFMVVLAEWYMDNGDCERALDHYEVAATLIPDNEALITEYEAAQKTCTQK